MNLNQVRVLAIIAFASIQLQAFSQYHYYFGTIHAHSGYSDGNKDSLTSFMSMPYEDFEYAKHSLHMDYLGISEHNHSAAGMQLANYHRGVRQADSANQEGTFVSLYGMEWGEIASGGHVVVYGFDSLIGWETNNYDIFNAQTDYTGLFAKIAHHSGAFGYFAHPTNSDYNAIYTSPYNAVSDSAIIGTPFRSGPAFSTDTLYSDPSTGNYLTRFYDALKAGYHLGIGMDHDTHYSVFGRSQKGRTVVLADTLTRSAILDAYRSMRFYASDDWNAQISFTANGHTMGQIITEAGSPNLSISVIDPDGESNSSITIFYGIPGSGVAPTALTSVSSSLSLNYTPAIANGTSYYYFARILQADGDQIYTSPIWYTRSDFVAVPQLALPAIQYFTITPNPSNGEFMYSFTTSVRLNLMLDVYTAEGKQVYHHPVPPTNGMYAEQVQLPTLAKGIYLVRLSGEGLQQMQKMIIE